MKVLFISSGNSVGGLSPIIKNQGESLIKEGIELAFFTIKGRGIWYYINNIFILRKYLRSNKFTLFHAHYLLSGLTAAFAGARPLVISLMGSDIMHNKLMIHVVRLVNCLFKLRIIVKTEEMSNLFNAKNVSIIPNGVDINKFKPITDFDAKILLGWDLHKKHLLFPASKNRYEKNYPLIKNAIELVDDKSIELHTLNNIENEKMPNYYNASDIVVLASLREGSPNVIKEAMACNKPIVSVDVGDVKKNIENTNGCYICSYDAQDFADKIKKALFFSQNIRHTNGRKQILELGLDSTSIAKKIIHVYEEIIGIANQPY